MNLTKLFIGYLGIIIFWILTWELEIFPEPESFTIKLVVIIMALISATIYNTLGILNILVRQGIYEKR